MRRLVSGRRALQICLATALVVVSSCNRGPATFPVTGTVAYPDGSPLKGGMVEFRGKDVSASYLAKGVIGADGRFALHCGDSAIGAVPGIYYVAVAPEVPEDSAGMSPAEYQRAMRPIDPKYMNSSTSGLQFTVTDDPAKNDFRIVVQRPRK